MLMCITTTIPQGNRKTHIEGNIHKQRIESLSESDEHRIEQPHSLQEFDEQLAGVNNANQEVAVINKNKCFEPAKQNLNIRQVGDIIEALVNQEFNSQTDDSDISIDISESREDDFHLIDKQSEPNEISNENVSNTNNTSNYCNEDHIYS